MSTYEIIFWIAMGGLILMMASRLVHNSQVDEDDDLSESFERHRHDEAAPREDRAA